MTSTDDDQGLQVGLNRIALVAMYRMWTEVTDAERNERVAAIFEENDLEGSLSTLASLVASLDLMVKPEAGTQEPTPAADHPDYSTGLYL